MLKIERKYYKGGNIKNERYYLNGKYHREDGPANIWYYENGNIELEEYFINGKCHREGKPAVIFYCEDSNIEQEEYWINDIEITDELQIMVLKGLK